jgi:hypothetical protein
VLNHSVDHGEARATFQPEAYDLITTVITPVDEIGL